MNTLVPVFLASGFDWETLLPLLIFVLYGVSQLFGRKKEEEATDVEIEVELREQMAAEAEQERIRRKIEERVNMPDSTDIAPNPLVRPPVLREVTAQERADDLASAQTFATARASEHESLQKRLAVQRERLSEARRINTEATRKAYSIAGGPSANQSRRGKVISSGSLGQVRSEAVQMLNHPSSLRKAIILREILGPPLAEKQQQNGLPL